MLPSGCRSLAEHDAFVALGARGEEAQLGDQAHGEAARFRASLF